MAVKLRLSVASMQRFSVPAQVSRHEKGNPGGLSKYSALGKEMQICLFTYS